jgi:mannitol/fructose-specific phosphotransferase system IIA component (Ntr-type)
LGARIDSKEAAIRLLTERVAETHHGLDREQLFRKVMEREALTSTTYENGVAIPHARFEHFEDLIIAVLIPETPVDSTRIMFLILADLTRSNLYLNVLAAITRISHNPENLKKLYAAKSPQDFIRLLESYDLTVKKVVYVSDLMSAPPKYLFPESTVKDALDFMSLNGLEYIPICDTNRRLLGEISIHDILSIGLPQYAQMLINLKFLSSLEPFEDLLKNETEIQLRSIMRTPPAVLTPQAIVFEAAFQFVKLNRHQFPVVKDGECIGVLSQMDLVNKFLRV